MFPTQHYVTGFYSVLGENKFGRGIFSNIIGNHETLYGYISPGNTDVVVSNQTAVLVTLRLKENVFSKEGQEK